MVVAASRAAAPPARRADRRVWVAVIAPGDAGAAMRALERALLSGPPR